MNLVYALSDPRDGEIRYVGITKCGLAVRTTAHIRRSRYGERSHKANWIRSLLAENLRPVASILEETEDRSREIYWIAKLRSEGLNLVNGTDGGEGWFTLSEDAKRRRAETSKGRIASQEARRRMSEAQKGKKRSPETIAKLRLVNLGKKHGPHSESARAKMSATKIGHLVSEDTRAKISAKLKGRPSGRVVTHCKNGHAYDAANTFMNVRGAKECRICQSIRYRKSYEKRKAAGLV